MARLNTHLSATPQASRASTVDSLYRNPSTVSSRRNAAASTQRESSYSVLSPSRSITSDKENHEPDSERDTPRPTKPKRPMASSSARLPTPNSGSSSRGSKRRRTDDYSVDASLGIYHDGDDDDAQEEEVDDEDEEPPSTGVEETAESEDEHTKYYDPNQNPDVRRQIRAEIRNNTREMQDNHDELVKPDDIRLVQLIKNQDRQMGKVKQTTDAALDSRALVLASDLATKKLANTLNGTSGVGIDIDRFVSRCIHFMKSGGDIPEEDRRASTQARNRARAAEEEDDEEDTGEGLEWDVLGRQACFAGNKRPPVTSFLLGPLSITKRARMTQSNRARSQRQPTGPATRPQELQQSDIQQSENTNLTHRVKEIKKLLEDHIVAGVSKAENELNDDDDDETVEMACQRHRIRQSPRGEPCVSLFDFVVNPTSFGQTVENLFYVSFLIREGNVQVLHDKHGLPLVVPCQQRSLNEHRERSVKKHQAVFSLDWPTWKTFIDAFDIKEPLIPHRAPDQSNIAPGGWYS
ncbi:Nse4-domain-containing protein [Amniculicola lignicola CBS 123094]|uniref:Non-structural maintenance of chromosomes element 4 n=1 Tax=Amniculicola lignicola CBS 123094 TaxID=1392246 RepID=A0A6A5W122_9PLEO|nr:Nse4-domain-containing protein [Amniculicola lignicola CBS 123094]